MGLLDDLRERRKFANLDPSDPSISVTPQGTQLQLEGVDPSRLQQAAQQTRGSEFGSSGCGSGSVPVYDGAADVIFHSNLVGCLNYGSFGGMENMIIYEKDDPYLDINYIPEDMKFGVLLSGFLKGLEYGSAEYNEASQTGSAWQTLLRRYNAGEAGLSDLRDFDGSGLEGWGRWNEIYTGTINEESVLGENADIREILRRNGYSEEAIDEIFDAEVNSTTGSGQFEGNNVLSNALCEIGYINCSDWSVKPIDDDGPAIGSGCTDANQREGVIDENGDCQFTAGGQCMKGSVPGTTDASGECITDDGTDDETGDYSEEETSTAQAIKDWIEGQIGRVQDMTVDDVLDVIFGGNAWDPQCKDEGDLSNCTGTDGTQGNKCWKDCVNISVLGGIPGLPMPPGAVDIGTVRDLENTANEIGTTIGSILNPDENDEGFIQKVKDWVTGKIDEIFGNVDDVTLEQITGWITGTLGSVLGGLILIETENVTNTVTDKIDEILGLPLDDDGDDDDDDITIDYGMCDDGLTPKEDQDGTNCSGVEPINEIGDPCTTGDGKDGTYQDVDGELKCVSSSTDDDDDDVSVDDSIDCESPLPAQPMSTLIERQTAWNNKCVPQGYCPITGPGETPTKAVDHQGGDCSQPLTSDDDDDCPEGTEQCPEGTISISGEKCVSNVATECVQRDPDDTVSYQCNGNPSTSNEIQQCLDQGWTTCPDNTNNAGQWINPQQTVGQDCGGTVTTECKNGATNFPECNQCPSGQQLIGDKCEAVIIDDDDDPVISEPPEGECWNNAVDFPSCQTCPEGQTLDDEGMCFSIYTCPDPNATVNADGSCGPCKAGYVFDSAVQRCVQESTPNPCDNPAYAAANEDECGTSPPPPEPPEPPEDGGGGGGGMFRPQAGTPPTLGDPQLLARLEFPIVDYLSESLAKQTKNDLMSGMLTGNIV